jgi:hypothetical protein
MISRERTLLKRLAEEKLIQTEQDGKTTRYAVKIWRGKEQLRVVKIGRSFLLPTNQSGKEHESGKEND